MCARHRCALSDLNKVVRQRASVDESVSGRTKLLTSLLFCTARTRESTSESESGSDSQLQSQARVFSAFADFINHD